MGIQPPRRCGNCRNCKDCSFMGHFLSQKEQYESQVIESKINYMMQRTMQRTLTLSQEKGAGSWLTTNPTKSLGFALNKQQFRDSVCLRYGWRVPNTPSHCQCGKKYDIDHAMNCRLGRYVIMRHDRLRDLERLFSMATKQQRLLHPCSLLP